MIINQQYRCIFARIFRDRSVVKLGMTWDFDSQVVGSSPTAPSVTGSKSMADGWFWEPAGGGSNPLSPKTYSLRSSGVQTLVLLFVLRGSSMVARRLVKSKIVGSSPTLSALCFFAWRR